MRFLIFWTKPDTGLYDCQSQLNAEIYVRMLATSFHIAYMLYVVFYYPLFLLRYCEGVRPVAFLKTVQK